MLRFADSLLFQFKHVQLNGQLSNGFPDKLQPVNAPKSLVSPTLIPAMA